MQLNEKWTLAITLAEWVGLVCLTHAHASENGSGWKFDLLLSLNAIKNEKKNELQSQREKKRPAG